MTTSTSRKGPGKWSSTFQWWDEYLPGKVKIINKEVIEDEGYESTYVRYFNALMDAGWKREGGKWVSPCGEKKFDRIDKAYMCFIGTKAREGSYDKSPGS